MIDDSNLKTCVKNAKHFKVVAHRNSSQQLSSSVVKHNFSVKILKFFANSAWKKFTNHRIATDDEIVNKDLKITTVYWHLLDFHKNNGKWVPPLKII